MRTEPRPSEGVKNRNVRRSAAPESSQGQAKRSPRVTGNKRMEPWRGDRRSIMAIISAAPAGAGFVGFPGTPGRASFARAYFLIAAPRLASDYFTAPHTRGSEDPARCGSDSVIPRASSNLRDTPRDRPTGGPVSGSRILPRAENRHSTSPNVNRALPESVSASRR